MKHIVGAVTDLSWRCVVCGKRETLYNVLNGNEEEFTLQECPDLQATIKQASMIGRWANTDRFTNALEIWRNTPCGMSFPDFVEKTGALP